MAARNGLEDGGEVQYKDITFFLNQLGTIQTDVKRDGWTVPITNDISVIDDEPRYKPRSLATQKNDFSPDSLRRLNFRPSFNDENAGNLTLIEYDNYIFIFDMKLKKKYRGMGGGSLMMDLFKASVILTDKEWAGGFVGDGNTLEFLKSQGFQRAKFEHWTNNAWASQFVSGEFVIDGDYYGLAEGDKFGLVPTPTDIQSEFSGYVVEPTGDGEQWTREIEQEMAKEGPTGIDPEGKVIFTPRVRQDVAIPFWTGGWSTWFKIPSRKIEYEESVFPITNRNTPIIDRFRDPTFSIF